MDSEVIISKYKHIKMEIEGHRISTDQPEEKGGTGKNPQAWKLWLASVSSCTLTTSYGYCMEHNLPLPTSMNAHIEKGEDKNYKQISFEIHLPADFPTNRFAAVQKTADTCWVKRQWHNPPQFSTTVVRE